LVSKFNIKYLLLGREKTFLELISLFLVHFLVFVFHDSSLCHEGYKTKDFQINTNKEMALKTQCRDRSQGKTKAFAANIFLQF